MKTFNATAEVSELQEKIKGSFENLLLLLMEDLILITEEEQEEPEFKSRDVSYLFCDVLCEGAVKSIEPNGTINIIDDELPGVFQILFEDLGDLQSQAKVHDILLSHLGFKTAQP